ncbi:DUF6438 domain-containing protein [Alteromonas sp.]|nr:DUF6438 domain-containing protein [Alteromonas sp.]
MRYLIFLLSLIPAGLNAAPSAADVFIMETTACFGTCPAYKVSVFSDGVIIFSGEAHTLREGTFRLPDNQALFQNILRLLDENGFQKFRDDYGWSGEGEESPCREEWTDHPSTVLSLQFASKIKTVHHYHGCIGFEREDELESLEKALFETIGLDTYVRQ